LKVVKIFMHGRSQTVRLPKDCHFDCEEVFVQKQGNEVILTAKRPGWDEFFDSQSVFGDDFFAEREDSLPISRAWHAPITAR
jgi:antitoxin VapB